MFSVYGSSGFIGSRFVDMYPTESIAIDREQNNPMSADVLYFISTAHNYYIFEKPHLDIDTNLNKLIDVLEAFRLNNPNGVFNFISSWFVYGMNSTMDTKESDYPDPRGFYSITKRAAEQMLMCYCDTYNLKYRILRMTNIIGEGDRGVSTKKNALQHMMGLLKKNEPVRLYDEGSNIRDYMHVDDICRAIYLCLEKSDHNQIINIGSGVAQNFKEIIDFAIAESNSSSKTSSIEAADFHKLVQVKDMVMDVSKLKELGFCQSIPIQDGIKQLINI